jgi:phosphotriesterase-related protein
VLEEGYAVHVTLTHDSVEQWVGHSLVMPDAILPAVKDWHPTHIHDDILPELLRGGVSAEQIRQMTV